MTDTTVTTQVEHLNPGSLYPESEYVSVDTRDPARDAANAPANAFAFRYFDIATTTVNVGSSEVATRSGELNPSQRFYIDAQELTCADVEALPGDNRILLAVTPAKAPTEWSVMGVEA